MALIAHWKMNDNAASTTVIDSIGSFNGTAQQNTSEMSVAGKLIRSLAFNGSDYITTNCTTLKTANNFSIALWFNNNALAYADHMIWQGGVAGNGWSPPSEMHLSIGNYTGSGEEANLVSFYLGSNSANVGKLSIKTAHTDTNVWHYIIVLVQNMDTVPIAELFLNNASVGTDVGTTAITDRTGWDTAFRIGKPGANQRYWDGELDDIRIYNHALTESERSRLFNNGLGVGGSVFFTDNPSYIYTEDIGHRTSIITMEDGGEQRNSYGTARRVFTLNFDRVTETIKDSIIAFYDARYGRYEIFNWYNPNDDTCYTVRFVPESLSIEEADYQMYNIQLQLLEVI